MLRCRRCVPVAQLLTACLFAFGLTAPCHAADPPNVLFLVVDDMKDWVHCLQGYSGTVHTPHIDRLAKRGLLFTNAHCVSPKCAPSRAAVMLGLRPSTTGLYDNGHWWYPHLPDAVTIPQCFRNGGYQVAGAGKVFHHTAGNNPPHLWDEFLPLIFRNDPWFRTNRLNYPWSPPGPAPDTLPLCGIQGLSHENDWGSLPVPDQDLDDVRSADFAIEFLQRSHSQPFFLACGLFRPHLPWYVPQRFFDMYPLADVVLPETRADDLDDVPPAGKRFAQARAEDFQRIQDVGKYQAAVRAYLASISFADDQLGRILDALDHSGHRNNTVIVLWSDHGWHLGEKGHWHKSTLWEEATRVPFIIAAPGLPVGNCQRPVSLIDLYPTLIELCSLTPPPQLDGVSLVPLLQQPDADWNRPAVIEYLKGNAAVRDDRYRYIRYRNGDEELYDLQTDPAEFDNLASDPDLKPLKARLANWLPSTWAEPAPVKRKFEFDPKKYSWTELATGQLIRAE